MSRQHVSFEWHLVEDDATWDNLPVQEWGADNNQLLAARQTVVDVDYRLTAQLLRSLTIGLAGLILVAAVDISADERARRHAITGLSTLLTQETAETEAGDEQAVTLLWETPAPPGLPDQPTAPAIGLVRVEPIGELTLAEVVLNDQPSNWRMTTPYRETRFYHETDAGWRQIRPDEAFWGEAVVRETAHLRFEFTTRDAPMVEPLLEPLDALYVTAHTFLGLDLPVAPAKLTIEITPERVTGWGMSDDRIRVASPVMSQIPIELSAPTFLRHQITSRLLSLVISTPPVSQSIEPASERSFLGQWRTMRRGLRSWLQYELVAERWPWDQQAATFFQQSYQPAEPLTLGALWWGNGQQLAELEQMMWQSAAAESVVDYAVVTYGPEILPRLWRGFHTYETSADWVDGVFDLTVEEFEAGWNQYLAARQD
jgi:hypothetical protein